MHIINILSCHQVIISKTVSKTVTVKANRKCKTQKRGYCYMHKKTSSFFLHNSQICHDNERSVSCDAEKYEKVNITKQNNYEMFCAWHTEGMSTLAQTSH